MTCSDGKNGDFLIKHWLKSLQANVNLKNTDIVVIDYGLRESQKKILSKKDVILFSRNKKSHIVNQRFFDAGQFLKRNSYDQILFIDGGDIIFQEDINDILDRNKNVFRVAPLGMEVLFFEWFIFNNFEEKIKRDIWRVVKNKRVLNAGVIFAPVDKFIELCDLMETTIKNKDGFGPDQIILNFYLYKGKGRFKLLDEKYNFMMSTTPNGFIVKNGVFYKADGGKVAIVHNSGQMDFFRPIENFGYGKDRNQIKHLIYHAKKTQYQILGLYKKIFSN